MGAECAGELAGAPLGDALVGAEVAGAGFNADELPLARPSVCAKPIHKPCVLQPHTNPDLLLAGWVREMV